MTFDEIARPRTPAEGTGTLALLDWIGRLGAASADHVADRFALAPATARRRLATLVADRLLERAQPLRGEPALYVATAAGLRCCALRSLGRCRVRPAGYAHWRACAAVAVALEREHAAARVVGERELRCAERAAGAAIASAVVGILPTGEPRLHRPDLVLLPAPPARPVAIEVELTVKAPRRLVAICKAWARCRAIDGVVYFAAPAAARAVGRAVDAVHARDVIAVRPLAPTATAAIETVPGAA